MRMGFVWMCLLGITMGAWAQEDAAHDGVALVAEDYVLSSDVRYFGAYLNGRVSVGTLSLSTRSVHSGGFGVTTEWNMNVGDSTFSNRVTAKLDERLAIVDWLQVESEAMGQATSTKTTHLRTRSKNRWVGEQSSGGAVVKGELKVKGHPHYGALESLLLLVPKFAENPPGVYRFSEIMNRLEKAPEAELLSAGYFDLHIHETANFEHRGQQRPVRVVRALWNAEKSMTFIVSSSGDLLSFWNDKVPLRFVQGSKEEVGRNMPIAEGVVRDTDPRTAVRVFLEVIAGAKNAEQLDEVIDWSAVIRQLGKEANDYTVDSFRKVVKARLLESGAPFAASDIPLLIGMLDVVQEDGKASVQMEGQNGPFLLELRGAQWWIVGLPK